MFGSLPPKKRDDIQYTQKYPEIPKNTRKYPEIPESNKDTRKYPIVYFNTPTRPDPTRYPVFFPIPDPTRPNTEKPYSLGTGYSAHQFCLVWIYLNSELFLNFIFTLQRMSVCVFDFSCGSCDRDFNMYTRLFLLNSPSSQKKYMLNF